MSLTPEWRNRIDNWRAELARHFYRPLGTLALEGYTTMEQLSPKEAAAGPFAPIPAGTPWGRKWEYGWFRTRLTVPEEARGRRVVLRLAPGGESIVYVNGIAAGALDQHHTEITLAEQGVPGARYEILLETYAGHGPRVHTVGPLPPERESVPEPIGPQTAVGESSFGLWEEDAFQLWMDIETLYTLRDHLDPDSLRVAEIDAALRGMTLIVDFELPYPERVDTFRACREFLRAPLACVNGSTAPTFFAFGHAHIDVAWLWPLAETQRKCLRTFATQLALMDEYPDYKFLQSQAHLYRWVKELDPELYERIREPVKRGQWIIEGGMWVEADTNLSGGESLIRQLLHGKRFFREEFGVECRLLWLPDVFGYSGNLPQIMRGCGIEAFSTHKIFWTYNGGDTFPYNTFTWEGIDGSEVRVHLHNDYNSRTDPGTLIERWKSRVQKDGIATRLLPFGFGDGGGGPTRVHLEYIRRLGDLEGAPRVRLSHPLDFFSDGEKRGWPEERYVGELYYQAHRGTLTSQARTKRGNRKSEIALREAELWCCAARALRDHPMPAEALDIAWKKVLLNQFHDIIPGSSIRRVYEEAEAAYDEVIKRAGRIAEEAATALVDKAEWALSLFNSLNWERRVQIPLPNGAQGATQKGQPLPCQQVGDQVWVEAVLPPCGWATLHLSHAPLEPQTKGEAVQAGERSLENELLRVLLDDRGEIVSLYDKEANTDWAAGPCNQMRLYKDVPARFDAWDIDSMYTLSPLELADMASITVVSQGPLFGRLRIERRLHESTMVQEITLRRGSRCIEFDTVLDWQERHKLLKVAFPVTIHADEALHEIQFGHIRRPTHRSRPFDADRFEVCNHKWTALVEEGRGCAVLNDSKYGVNVLGNCIALTLLKAPLAPDMTADLG
ncbi:MAG: alpha-mannosidase, partial [Chloroflexi bacterium]|nr:alpha-mannosidase [Chloroflexota bacterium]